jgi:SAM-dependent methyltransferase
MEDASHAHGAYDHHSEAGHDDAGLVELLDLDGEVLHSYLSELTAWIQELSAGNPPRRMLDIGSGTGTGTLALLERFGGATVVALDVSAPRLDHLNDRARRLGVADRIRTMEADLDTAWPRIDPVDLAWASSSLHHLADPVRALSEVLTLLRPGGLLVVAEMDSFPRFLPDEIGLGLPGLEARVHAAVAERRAAELPHFGADWGAHLVGAGFIVEAERRFAIELTPPLPPATGLYARATLGRIRPALDGLMSDDDLATLDHIMGSDGPDGIQQRDDLTVVAERAVWIARRPSDR